MSHVYRLKFPQLKGELRKVKYIRLDISNKKEVKKKIKQTYDYVVNLGGYVNHTNKKKTYNLILLVAET